MAYEKQTWKTGDVITEEKLNHMEDGISNVGGIFFVKSTYSITANQNVLDKTWQEIKDAFSNGNVVVINDGTEQLFVNKEPYGGSGLGYVVESATVGPNSVVATYIADAVDSYPMAQDGGGDISL